MLRQNTLAPSTLDALLDLVPGIDAKLASFAYEAVRAGNRKIAKTIFSAL